MRKSLSATNENSSTSTQASSERIVDGMKRARVEDLHWFTPVDLEVLILIARRTATCCSRLVSGLQSSSVAQLLPHGQRRAIIEHLLVSRQNELRETIRWAPFVLIFLAFAFDH